MIRLDTLKPSWWNPARALRSRLGDAATRSYSQTYEQMRNKPVLALGRGLFFALTFSLALPLHLKNTQEFTALYILASVLFTLLCIGVTRRFVRPVFPVAIVLLFQVWLVTCYFLVGGQLALGEDVGRHLYWPIIIVLPYYVLGSICILDPSWRQTALRILFWFCMINALIGIAQFLRLPGFAALQSFYAPKTLAADFFGNTPHLYRAVGLTLHPYHLAAQCLFCIALIGSNLFERKLYPREVFSAAIFFIGLFVAQSRAYYASGALVFLVLLYLMYRRDKPLFLWGTSALIAGVLVMGYMFTSRLEYGLAGKNIAESGRLERWEAAANIVREHPLTGLGPNKTLFGTAEMTIGRRRGIEYTENGYRMIAGSLGLPGLALLLVGLAGSFAVCVRIVRKTWHEPLQRRMAFVGALYVMSIAVALNITNMFEHELLTFFGFCTAAIMVPDVGKAFGHARARKKLGEGFANGPQPVPVES